MARTKQKLINFHSSGNTVVPFSDLEYGEIAVRHRTQPGESELVIKTSTTSGVSFVEKSKVQTMISEGVSQVTTDMTEIAKSLSAVSATAVSAATALADEIIKNGEFHEEVRINLSGHVATLTQNLSDNYYTKDEVDDELEERDTEIGDVKTGLSNLYTATSAFMETVANTYAESVYVVTEIGKASGAAVTSANSYTDTKLADYYTTSQVDNKISTINTDTGKLRTDLIELSGVTSALSASVQTIEIKANSALQGFEFTGTNVTTSGTQTIQSGAKANYTTGGTATLDLSELVIDCGNW